MKVGKLWVTAVAFANLFILSASFSLEPTPPQPTNMVTRKNFLQSVAICTALLTKPGEAFSIDNNPQSASTTAHFTDTAINGEKTKTIAYKALSITMEEQYGGANVPVACWYPVSDEAVLSSQDNEEKASTTITYPHRISVKRIGQMLVGWDWIPSVVSRNFPLQPTMVCVNGDNNAEGGSVPLPLQAPVVLLAHGYLGSRFDLSHIAESLAAEGFVCLSPEYPESLAASYDRHEGLDRTVITNQLLSQVVPQLIQQPTSYGIIGHSLGCGTAIRTGDATWTRVIISGNPGSTQSPIPGNVLFLSSMNDGVVSLQKRGGLSLIPPDYVQLKEDELAMGSLLPNRAALVFDRPDAPNHISFLAEGVNDAMVDFLSPLLPVAQALSIPVLDFDRYQASRDSIATAQVVRPLVTRYLKEHMKMT